MKLRTKEYQNTYIQFRTFIYQAKRVYGYLRVTKEGLEGEYIRLNKKDLLDRLDSLYLKDKDNWLEEIDIDAFHFHTKEGKVWYFGQKWLGRPLEVYID